jgi:tricorn protease
MGDKIFYVSDESLTLNFHSYDVNTHDFSQVTRFSDFDVLWPSGSNGIIVFEKGGYLYKLDTLSSKVSKINVNIKFDNPEILPYFKNVSEFISRFGATISSDGNRAYFDARGDIFSVPSEKEGVTLNMTRTSGIREMYPAASPDGKYLS